MSSSRRHALIVRAFPRRWRARYGDELLGVLEHADTGRARALRISVDVICSGARERLGRLSLNRRVPQGERTRVGALLVLCAWVLLTVAGFIVQKTSEHWQVVTPAGKRQLPAASFDVLVGSAVVGTIFVFAGIGAALPSLIRFLRAGGWTQVRGPVLRAIVVTGLMAAAMLIVGVWAQRLSNTQRNGGDPAYGAAFLVWFALAVACLIAWTAATISIARRLRLSPSALRLEARLSAGVGIAMAVMTVATAAWWLALARAAPWFFAGRPVGSSASALDPRLAIATALMVCATIIGGIGARAAVQDLRHVSDRPG